MRESTFTNAICKAESKQISKIFAYCEDALGRAENAIGNLPSAQPDLSSYSDKLWRNAYERGKAEAQAEIIRCRDCKYYREYGYVNGKPKFLPKCIFSSIYVNADDFCSRAERRTDEPDR